MKQRITQSKLLALQPSLSAILRAAYELSRIRGRDGAFIQVRAHKLPSLSRLLKRLSSLPAGSDMRAFECHLKYRILGARHRIFGLASDTSPRGKALFEVLPASAQIDVLRFEVASSLLLKALGDVTACYCPEFEQAGTWQRDAD